MKELRGISKIQNVFEKNTLAFLYTALNLSDIWLHRPKKNRVKDRR